MGFIDAADVIETRICEICGERHRFIRTDDDSIICTRDENIIESVEGGR